MSDIPPDISTQVPVPGVENIGVSRLINGHSDYVPKMEEVLEAVNLKAEEA